MKSILLLVLLLVSGVAHAWIETPTMEKPHHFIFRLNDSAGQPEKFELTLSAPTYEEAYAKAAQTCYTHFKGGHHLSEERGLDIIDVCANPRSL